MEHDRKYVADSTASISRHRSMISKLEADNKMLMTELSMEQRSSKLNQQSESSGKIAVLQNEGDKYTRKIELEKRRNMDLENSIAMLTVKITELRHKRGGADATAMSASNLKKKIRMLENRLDKALVRYNESLANNRALREKIENSRRDRVVFDGIYKKLERQLHDKKKELAVVIEQSNEAYETRDKAQSDMQLLKATADKKQADFEERFHQLGEVIEQERTARDMAAGVVPDASGHYIDSEHRGNLSMDQELNIKKKVAKGAWNIAKDKAQMHLSSEKVQSYEEAFQQIQKATGIADIDELVTKFVEAEDKNFSLFNFVNELNSEIERLEMMISDTKAEIEKFKGQGLNTDNQRKKILHDLESRLQRTVSKADEYEEKYQTAMKRQQREWLVA